MKYKYTGIDEKDNIFTREYLEKELSKYFNLEELDIRNDNFYLFINLNDNNSAGNIYISLNIKDLNLDDGIGNIPFEKHIGIGTLNSGFILKISDQQEHKELIKEAVSKIKNANIRIGYDENDEHTMIYVNKDGGEVSLEDFLSPQYNYLNSRKRKENTRKRKLESLCGTYNEDNFDKIQDNKILQEYEDEYSSAVIYGRFAKTFARNKGYDPYKIYNSFIEQDELYECIENEIYDVICEWYKAKENGYKFVDCGVSDSHIIVITQDGTIIECEYENETFDEYCKKAEIIYDEASDIDYKKWSNNYD